MDRRRGLCSSAPGVSGGAAEWGAPVDRSVNVGDRESPIDNAGRGMLRPIPETARLPFLAELFLAVAFDPPRVSTPARSRTRSICRSTSSTRAASTSSSTT